MKHLPVGQADEGFADGVRHQNERVRIVGGINMQPVTNGSSREIGGEWGKGGIVLLGGAPIFDGLGHCVGEGFGCVGRGGAVEVRRWSWGDCSEGESFDRGAVGNISNDPGHLRGK